MSSDGTNVPHDSGQLLAAEYVLGVLGAADRQRAQQRLAHDQAFADEVAFWEERIGSLADSIEPVEPPAQAWNRILRGVKGRHPAEPRESLWASLVFWRSFAIGSAVLALASIGALTFIEISPPPRGPMLATLLASNGQPNFVAAVNAGGTSMLVTAAAQPAPDQRAMQLWLIPPGDRPHSLGLIQPGRTVRVDVPRDLAPRIASDAVLAVSIEPPGGSTTGLPTGPVIANGKLTSL